LPGPCLFLIGDKASSTAIVVDPQRDIQQYLSDSQRFGLEIRHVFLTHFHADFVADHLELRDRAASSCRLYICSLRDDHNEFRS
jgi:hydroxyacylglutathione hydrolase